MKSILRKIVILACVTMLLIMPSASALASTTSQPTLLLSTSGSGWTYRMWQYQPEPLDLLTSQTVTLTDTTTGQPHFYTPAGQDFTFSVYVSGVFQCRVYRIGNNSSQIVYNSDGAPNIFGSYIPAVDYACSYIIQLTSITQPQYNTAKISTYDVQWFY